MEGERGRGRVLYRVCCIGKYGRYSTGLIESILIKNVFSSAAWLDLRSALHKFVYTLAGYGRGAEEA